VLQPDTTSHATQHPARDRFRLPAGISFDDQRPYLAVGGRPPPRHARSSLAARGDGCIARMMPNSNRARPTSDAALLRQDAIAG
jgi:hypothetical protein